MIPPKPDWNASHVMNEAGESVPMNLWQRLEAKLDYVIDCLHAMEDHGPCVTLKELQAPGIKIEPQEVS